ncbi:MAG: HTH-type transcriptional regulator, sugar sensing transcriptional regulator [Thermoplasmata archaeon]|jgi:sugar-specific transcriptional regulator TrmB|nr:HTH-type transcriptional regulator, sugar sensing transcriptional regulator [Thermoplasmata archaeon]
MKVDDVVARLTACGLGEKEARALAHLTRLGTSKVTDLAKASGLKRAETYQILERLQGRGLVEGTLSRPRNFTAVTAERAVAILVEERAAQLKAVEGMKEDLQERLGRLAGAPAATEAKGESFRILHDRNQINGQLGRTLRAAQKEICVVASSRSLFRLLLDEGLEGEFLAARKRDVEIRIMTEVLPGAEEVVLRMEGFAQVRHMMVPRPLRFLIADEREIVQYVTADPLVAGSKETALWIGARDHVQAQRAFFDDLWSLAMSADARREELESGRASEQVQVVKGRLTRYEKEKEMILRATREVCLVLSSGDAARLEKSGIARALASRIREGVRVRVLTPEGSSVAIPGAQTRMTRESQPRTLVDASEVLFVFTGKGATDEVTDPAEYGVWVSLGPSVELLQRVFETQWREASEAR